MPRHGGRGQDISFISRCSLGFVDGDGPSIIKVRIEIGGKRNLFPLIELDENLLLVKVLNGSHASILNTQAIIVSGKNNPVSLRKSFFFLLDTLFPKVVFLLFFNDKTKLFLRKLP